MSALDWDFVSKAPAGGAAAQAAPKRDMVAVEGQAITLGDESITPVFDSRTYARLLGADLPGERRRQNSRGGPLRGRVHYVEAI